MIKIRTAELLHLAPADQLLRITIEVEEFGADWRVCVSHEGRDISLASGSAADYAEAEGEAEKFCGAYDACERAMLRVLCDPAAAVIRVPGDVARTTALLATA